MQSCGLCLRCAQGWSFLQRLTNADVRAAGGKWCADLQLLPCAVHGMPLRSILQAETCSVTAACRAHQQVDDWLDQGSGFQPAVWLCKQVPHQCGCATPSCNARGPTRQKLSWTKQLDGCAGGTRAVCDGRQGSSATISLQAADVGQGCITEGWLGARRLSSDSRKPILRLIPVTSTAIQISIPQQVTQTYPQADHRCKGCTSSQPAPQRSHYENSRQEP